MKRPLAAAIALCLMLAAALPAARAADTAYSRSVLDGGLTLVSQRAGGDLAAACLFVKVGSACEDAGNNGVTSLLNRLVLACHPLAGAAPPVLKIEQLGGRVTAETSGSYSCFTLVVPVRNFPEALKVLADAVAGPDCSEATLSTERAALDAERTRLGDRLADRAYGVFMKKTYAGRSCGLDPAGTAQSVGRLGIDDVERWRDTYYRPANMTLSITADIGPEQAAKLAAQAFKGLTAASGPDGGAETPDPGGQCVKVDMFEETAAGTGAAAVIGYSAPSPDSPDYPALRLAAALLSEGMGSSVFRELRENNRSAYSFGSVMPAVSGSSRLAFYVVTDPGSLGDAVNGIKRSVESLRDGDVTDEELARAKGMVLGELTFRSETACDRAWNAGYYESMGLGPDYLERLAGLVDKVGKKELSAAAGRYLGEYTQVVLRPGNGAR
ncbi:MAG: insulinase family protein [Nitrospirae bacterium]|nr:insulinase family protein [Nitrospirota bacterium]